MKKISLFFYSLCFLFLAFLTSTKVQARVPTDFDENDPMLVVAKLERSTFSPGQTGKLIIDISLPEKFHAYSDQFEIEILEPSGFLTSELKINPQVEFFDKFSGKKRFGVNQSAQLILNIEAPPRWIQKFDKLTFEFTYQACSTTFCLFPTTQTHSVPLQVEGFVQTENTENNPAMAANENAASAASNANGSTQNGLSSLFFSQQKLTEILEKNIFLALFFVFIAGILTSFTPCIFPMIPITLAVLGHESEKHSRLQNFLLSLSYVHGIAFTYAILGLIAASSGALFGASLGNPWVLGVLCVLFFLMSLSMYGVFEIQVPAFLRNGLGNKKLTVGYVNAFISGLIAGVVASPCVGPVLVGILSWVATTGSKFYGFILLFTYAMGLGLIFLLLGAFSELTKKLPRSGPWLNGVKFLLGTLMLGVFYYYLSFLIPLRFHDGALGVGLVALASIYGAFAKPHEKNLGYLKKGFLQAMLVVGFGYLVVSALNLRPFIDSLQTAHSGPVEGKKIESMVWDVFTDEKLKVAQKSGRPIIIDFWAEWCAACFELEEKTFTNSEVIELSKNFQLLRFDATQDTPEMRRLKKEYKIQGLPTVLFFDSNGEWRPDLTLTQYEKASSFTQRMKKVK